MIVNGDGEHFLGVVLTNDVVVEVFAEFSGSWDAFFEERAGVFQSVPSVAAG